MKRIHHFSSLILVIVLLSACGGGSSSGGGGGAPDQDTAACEILGPTQFTTDNDSQQSAAAYTIENTGTVSLTLEQISASINTTSGVIAVNGELQDQSIIEAVLQPGDFAVANLLWAVTCTPPATTEFALSALHSSSDGPQTCSVNVRFSCTE